VKAKHQRLILLILALAAMIGAVLLAMSALSEQAAYFYAPGDVKRNAPPLDRAVRLGGMVQDKSIQREADGVTIRFVVEDGVATVLVRFTGIAPDLLLAKHDEKYMPPELEGKMHKSGSVAK
jgi:cytochrome c-type biogenesis protein CcmE